MSRKSIIINDFEFQIIIVADDGAYQRHDENVTVR